MLVLLHDIENMVFGEFSFNSPIQPGEFSEKLSKGNLPIDCPGEDSPRARKYHGMRRPKSSVFNFDQPNFTVPLIHIKSIFPYPELFYFL